VYVFTLAPEPGAAVDALADQITQEIPEPQEHAIKQAIDDAAKDPESPMASGAVETDALGIPWNPSEHATGADGKGVRTAKGTWRKRRGLKGSPSHLNTGAASAEQPKEDPSVTEKRNLEHQNRMAGAAAATILIRISTAIGGDEFQPRVVSLPGGINYNEEQFLQTAFGDYFVAKGYTDIPPGAVLASAVIMYYSPRFRSPVVRERGSRIVGWFKEKGTRLYVWFKYRGKKKPEREPDKTEPKTARDYIRERQQNSETNGARTGSRFGGPAHSVAHPDIHPDGEEHPDATARD
jgi:hypothetical protein